MIDDAFKDLEVNGFLKENIKIKDLKVDMFIEEFDGYGAFDEVPEKFIKLFPKDKDDISKVVTQIFEVGFRLGFKSGKSCQQLKEYAEELTLNGLNSIVSSKYDEEVVLGKNLK